MGILLEKYSKSISGQAMVESMVIAGILILVMMAFGLLSSTFLDYSYRSLRLISMEYP